MRARVSLFGNGFAMRAGDPIAPAVPRDGDARPVQWIVERSCALRGDGAAWALDRSVQPHRARCLMLAVSKARGELGQPLRRSLTDVPNTIVAWQRALLSGADMHPSCAGEGERFAGAYPNPAA